MNISRYMNTTNIKTTWLCNYYTLCSENQDRQIFYHGHARFTKEIVIYLLLADCALSEQQREHTGRQFPEFRGSFITHDALPASLRGSQSLKASASNRWFHGSLSSLQMSMSPCCRLGYQKTPAPWLIRSGLLNNRALRFSAKHALNLFNHFRTARVWLMY